MSWLTLIACVYALGFGSMFLYVIFDDDFDFGGIGTKFIVALLMSSAWPFLLGTRLIAMMDSEK